MTEETVKLQKFISDCGLMSRRAAEASICCGEFTVNGQPASLGDRVCPTRDVVRYRGKRVRGAGRKWYIMLNKPRGYVTTMSDERGRKSVAELVADLPARVYPIGRLDMDSEGLLLMTTTACSPTGSRTVLRPPEGVCRHGRRLRPERGGRPAARDARAGRRTDCALRGGHPRAVRAGEPAAHRTHRGEEPPDSPDGESGRPARDGRFGASPSAGVSLGGLQSGRWRELTPQQVRALVGGTGPRTDESAAGREDRGKG